ncbi:transglutaminase-like domain-containing protein [Flexithrix dorotheae]|uniref:transglutaminase-like domain-containing protein n=1 Tax=Flexithrix dorotheae TaxID=70993 RepID=UPI000381C600|nr:transglutaminase-like domain-containing protein [Flexithrix dorotheae]
MLDQKELKALVSLLDDEDQEVIVHVHKKLSSLGQSVIPFLEEEWENNDSPKVQERLQSLIQEMQFESIVKRLKKWLDSDQENLLKAMWIISNYQYPDLSYQSLKSEIEQLYYECWLEFKYDMQPFDQVKVLNGVIFNKLKFRAETKDFHSIDNSMINQVLSRKKGNPTTLCAVYMLIANKLKLPIYGVNLPNLFILTYKNDNIQFYINAFNKGLIFSKSDIKNYISQLKMEVQPHYFEPCTNYDIIRRLTQGLMISFEKKGKKEEMEDIKFLLNIIEDHKK